MADLPAVLERLREIVRPYESRLVVREDTPESCLLSTIHVRADGYRGWLGGAQLRKRYVRYHLLPVYAFPDLLDDVSPALRKRMQGRSCLNFTRVDDEVFAELAELTRRGYERYAAEGLA